MGVGDEYSRAGKSDFTVSLTTLTIPEGTSGGGGAVSPLGLGLLGFLLAGFGYRSYKLV